MKQTFWQEKGLEEEVFTHSTQGECDCSGHGCTGACEERHPPLVESMKLVADHLRRGSQSLEVAQPFRLALCDVASFLQKEVERIEKGPTENEKKLKEVADAVLTDF